MAFIIALTFFQLAAICLLRMTAFIFERTRREHAVWRPSAAACGGEGTGWWRRSGVDMNTHLVEVEDKASRI